MRSEGLKAFTKIGGAGRGRTKQPTRSAQQNKEHQKKQRRGEETTRETRIETKKRRKKEHIHSTDQHRQQKA
jgi:hypothetical protein